MTRLSLFAVLFGLCASAWAGGGFGGGGSMGGSGGSGSLGGGGSSNGNSLGSQGNMRGTFANKKKIGKSTAGAGGSGTAVGTQNAPAVAPLAAGQQAPAAASQSVANPPVPKTPVTVFGNNGFGLTNGRTGFGKFSGGNNSGNSSGSGGASQP